MKPGLGVNEVTIEVTSLVDLTTNLPERIHPEYITSYVSLNNDLKVFDYVSLDGNVLPKKSKKYLAELSLFENSFTTNIDPKPNYYVSSPRNIVKIKLAKPLDQKFFFSLYTLNETFKQSIKKHMTEPYAGIALALSLGDDEYLIKDIKDTFRTSGLIHILVLSGANVSFIISFFWFFANREKISKKISVTTTILFAWIFILTTGLTAPAGRAGFMSTISIAGEYFKKEVSNFDLLLLSLFLLTLLSPLSLVYSPSLHLSYLACFAVFICAPSVQNFIKLNVIHNSLVAFLISNFVSIFLFVTPYILALTGSSSVFGVLLTFLVEPFVLITTVLTFLIIIFSFVNFYMAHFLGLLNSISVNIIVQVSKMGANYLPNISLEIGTTFVVTYYIFLIVLMVLVLNPQYILYLIRKPKLVF
jgi:competence protein ComEC